MTSARRADRALLLAAVGLAGLVDDISCFYVSRLRGEPAAGVADVHLHPAGKRSFRLGVALTF